MQMINWEQISFSKSTALEHYEVVKREISKPSFVSPYFNFTQDVADLRNQLKTAFDDVLDMLDYESTSGKLDYSFDVPMALKVYEILSEEIGFTNRVASNDEVWRYLQVDVIPEITNLRHGKEDYFIGRPSRMYLKSLWWYVHLSWQGNTEDTRKVLEKCDTDIKMNLIERTAKGYYIDLYREIMKQYSELPEDVRKKTYISDRKGPFRPVMKLFISWLTNISPDLYAGGTKKFVADLYSEVIGSD